jgi:hypothetical protein
MNTNPAVDGLIGQLSPELEGVIGQAPNDPTIAPVTPPPFEIPGMAPQPPPTVAEVKKFEDEVHKVNNATVSPSIKRLGEIARMVPGAELIRVWKKDEHGKLGYIVDLQIRDVQASGGDLEAHIARYLVPRSGKGEYSTSVVDPKGKTIPCGIFYYLPDPAPTAGDGGALSLLRDMMNRQQNQPPPPDPLEAIVKTQETFKKLESIMGGGKSQDPLTMMMMLRAMEPPKPPPGPDPMLLAIIERMDRRQEALEKKLTETPPALPLAPPPPAGLSGMFEKASLGELATLIGTMVSLFRAQPDPNALTLDKLLPILRPGPDPNAFSPREVITMLEQRRQAEQPVTLEAKLGELIKLRELVTNHLEPQPQSQGDNFWSALGNSLQTLFSQERFAASLGQGIGAFMARANQPQLGQGAPKPGPQVEVLRPRPELPRQPAQPPPEVETIAPEQGNRVYFPEELRPLCQELDAATEDKLRIQTVVNMLMKLWPIPQWQPFVQNMLSETAENNKTEVLKGLAGWLDLLKQHGYLKHPTVGLTLRTFNTNWYAVHAGIASQLGKPVVEPQAGTPTPAPATTPNTPAANGPPASAQPAGDSEEPEDEEGDEDELEDEDDEGEEGDEDELEDADAPQLVDLPPDSLDSILGPQGGDGY